MPGMSVPASGGLMPLDPSQFNFSNETQAMDFLSQLLDDSILQYDAQNFSRYFWYGILAVVAGFTAGDLLWKGGLMLK